MTAELKIRLENFLHRYRAVEAIVGRAEAKIALLTADKFSIFNYCRPDELALSRIIADLLNPKGGHGQRALFLNLFLAGLNEKFLAETPPRAPLETVALTETIVTVEAATSRIENTKRRIDILAVNPHWVLGLENKPWAGEQAGQLADYQDHLDLKYDDRPGFMVYLAGDYSPPQTQGRKNPLLMGYHRGRVSGRRHFFLSDWLGEARDRCPVDKVRHFLADLSGWVEANFQPSAYQEEENGHGAINPGNLV